jgi:uncharacterized membrane protein
MDARRPPDVRIDPSDVRIDHFHRRDLVQNTSRQPDSNAIESSVSIRRPVEEVFRFYRDFRNLPSVLGDVVRVEPIDPVTSRWTIQGPLGTRVRWTITVSEERPNEVIRYGTAGWHTSWEIQFSPGPEPGSTVVREVVRSPLGRLGRAALALVGKFPEQEVTANLNRLKQMLETGRVTDTSYAVPGKFGGA